ncbi:ATP-binding protein [Desulfoluna butyratoxydans]|uniref:Sensor protein FixL n=1 Tax=Desulfoluna butyratoxydans TaxID=231438 RepID=A0A4U8YK09_9BACT|nr:ATP-binding protein [Desulfoluna butyratoxydans]VFQ44001.1 pas fold [Desulfoluna butyratoxydans]
MSLRLKLTLFMALFTATLLGAYLAWWLPAYTRRVESDLITLGEAEVALLAEAMRPGILSAPPGGLVGALEHTLETSPVWSRVILTDARGKQVYPPTPEPPETTPLTWFDASITHGMEEIATLRLGANVKALTAKRTEAAARMGLLLIALPGILTMALLLYMTRRITRPLNRLGVAAHHIARADFSVTLPGATGDEIGLLTHAFDTMKTRLAQREKKGTEDQRRLSAIINNAAAGLITIDHAGTLRSLNQAAERMFGYASRDVLGQNIRILMPRPYRREHDRFIRRYLQSGEKRAIGIEQQVKGRRKNGEVFPIWLAVSEMKQTEEPMFVGSILEITQQKSADAELMKHRDNLRAMIHERTKDLEVAMEKAESANRAKSNFISNMSHEIRTPMNALLGFLALALEKDDLPAELRSYLEVAHRSSWSLLGLLDDILDISKLEGNRMELEFTPFDLTALLRDISQTMASAAREKGLYLRLYMATPMPRYCSGDPMRLRQVLFNLLSNAVKFTHNGGVTIHVEALTGTNIHFAINDTGIGIPEDQLKRIFEPFAQADDSTTRRYGGTGLGTAIAKQLTELMGGTIWVKSEVGKGSTFHLTLALPEATAPHREAPQPHVPVPVTAAISVLVAEDIDENAKLIMIRLEQQGHGAVSVSNGQEVLKALAERPFDLILMDVHMPEMDGLEATRRIRDGASGKAPRTIPIIGLTASAGKQDVMECLGAGMDEVVTKPIDFTRLFAAIEATLPFEGLTAQPTAEPTDDSCNTWPRITGVDMQKAMATWGDRTVYLKALSSFVQKFKATPQAMLRAVEAGGTDGIHQKLHAIKGASANLCMTEVHRACQALTPLPGPDESHKARPLLLTLHGAFQRLAQALTLPDRKAPTTAHPERSPEQTATWFAELFNALGTDNPDRVAPLLEPTVACISEAHTQAIQDRVELFDFRGAEEEARNTARDMNIYLNGEAHGAKT